eukprot:TRINITY_DN26150_c0_g1_i2.p1 TRINITY_DN26150_c0_g1~~TRINITY_DN26150_c0_g1_i2.p1  ORF type:complete len:422 (-),score=30.76 TRINITY_DN26150_c0_g1_i2:391-1656(-)
MGRSYFGIPWDQLSPSQKWRRQKDEWYRTSHSCGGKKFVEVDRTMATAVKAMVKSKALHELRNRENGFDSHYARHASLAAAKAQVVDADALKSDLRIHRLANTAKHTHPARSNLVNTDTFDVKKVSSAPIPLEKLADCDDTVPDSWEDYLIPELNPKLKPTPRNSTLASLLCPVQPPPRVWNWTTRLATLRSSVIDRRVTRMLTPHKKVVVILVPLLRMILTHMWSLWLPPLLSVDLDSLDGCAKENATNDFKADAAPFTPWHTGLPMVDANAGMLAHFSTMEKLCYYQELTISLLLQRRSEGCASQQNSNCSAPVVPPSPTENGRSAATFGDRAPASRVPVKPTSSSLPRRVHHGKTNLTSLKTLCTPRSQLPWIVFRHWLTALPPWSKELRLQSPQPNAKMRIPCPNLHGCGTLTLRRL